MKMLEKRRALARIVRILGILNASLVGIVNLWLSMHTPGAAESWVSVLALEIVVCTFHYLIFAIPARWVEDPRISSRSLWIRLAAATLGVIIQSGFALLRIPGKPQLETLATFVVVWPVLGVGMMALSHITLRISGGIRRKERISDGSEPVARYNGVEAYDRPKEGTPRRRSWRFVRKALAIIVICATAGAALQSIDFRNVGFWGLFVSGWTILGAFVGVYAATLIFGAKQVFLFLRRFHRTGTNTAMQQGLERRLRRKYRIVALDDGEFPAIEVPPTQKWASRVAPALLMAFCLYLIYSNLTVRFNIERGFGDLIADAVNKAIFEEAFQPIATANLFALLLVSLVLLVHLYSVHVHAYQRLGSARELRTAELTVAEFSSTLRGPSLAAPQALVLRVADAMWQDAVRTLTRRCGAIVIDISEPTENIAWELEHCLANHHERLIAIAEEDALHRWSSDPSSELDEIKRLISRVDLITYGTTQEELRVFWHNLEARLDDVAETPRLGAKGWLRDPDARLHAAKRLARGILVLALCMVCAWTMSQFAVIAIKQGSQ